MHKINTFLLIASFLVITGVSAQPFKPGEVVIGAFEGYGNGKMDMTYFSYMSKVEGVMADICLPIPIDTGYIGIGFSYGQRNANYTKYYPVSTPANPYFLYYTWDYKLISTRLTYHINLLPIRHLDPYLGLTASYILVKWTPQDDYYFPTAPYGTVAFNAANAKANPYPGISYPNFYKFGGLVGLRYDLFNIIGVFGELSIGATYYTVGASIKI